MKTWDEILQDAKKEFKRGYVGWSIDAKYAEGISYMEAGIYYFDRKPSFGVLKDHVGWFTPPLTSRIVALRAIDKLEEVLYTFPAPWNSLTDLSTIEEPLEDE